MIKRRTLFKAGLLAGVAAGLNNSSIAAAQPLGSSLDRVADVLARNMLWARDVPAVPLAMHTGQRSIGGVVRGEDIDLHAVFCSDWTLAIIPARAELHLFTYTRYRLYVNGRYCGRGPNRFQNQRPEYDTRDLTALLRPGSNRIVVLVHRDAPTGRIMRHTPGFTALLELTGATGRISRPHPDTPWRGGPELSFGPRKPAWASIEENLDLRRSVDWAASDFDTSHWPEAIAISPPDYPPWPRSIPLQTETERAWQPSDAPTLPLALVPGSTVSFELPEIAQAFHLLDFEAEEGAQLSIRYALPEGETSGCSTCIARVGRQTWIGGDTFAFRSLELTLTGGHATVLAAQAFEVRYPFERSGSFECNDKRLNHLWTICARSSEVLSEDAFVDCADRERVEWTDNTPPSWQVARVIMSGPPARQHGKPVWGDGRLQKALLRRIALTAQPDGMMKAHSCSERWDIHAIMEDRSCDWVISLRDLYEASNDRVLVRELWPACVRLMNWFLAHRTERGLVLAREWEMWDNPLRYRTCEGAGLNAFIYWALRDAIVLGAVADDARQVKLFSMAADQLAIDFNRLLWNESEETLNAGLTGPGSHSAPSAVKDVKIIPDGPQTTPDVIYGHYGPTLQAAMLALESGIVLPERRAAVTRYVLTHQEDATMTASLWFLMRALYREETEAADARVLELMHKWWALQIDSPWQTTWEYPTGGSKIHGYGLGPAYFLSAWVLGARLGSPVWKRTIVIEPHPGGLTNAKGVAMTELGPVPVAWTRCGSSGLLRATFTIPARVTARVRLRGKALTVNGIRRASTSVGPYRELKLGAGEWTVEANA